MGTGFRGQKLPQEGVLLWNYIGVVTTKFLGANLVALAVHLWSILGSCELLGTGGGMLKHAHYITVYFLRPILIVVYLKEKFRHENSI